MATLAVIPARLGAVRLPRKPLRELGGRALILRVWEGVSNMNAADRVVVATDSTDIASVVRAAGGECIDTSSAHLSGTDRVAEVALGNAFSKYDLIINVQGDEPFLDAQAVRGAAEAVGNGAEIGTTAVRTNEDIANNPAVVKVVCTDHGRALYFSRAPIPFLRDASDQATHATLVRQHLGVYAYTRQALHTWVTLPPHPLEMTERLEQLRPLAAGLAIGVTTITNTPPMGGIDTEADLVRANALWTDYSKRSPS